jgi:hypothetical protein
MKPGRMVSVLGFGGIALICWQGAAMQSERRWYWLAGLAGALACAMLTHSYAVLLFLPIIFGELARSVSLRRVDWPIWVAIMVASAAILPSVTLVRSVLLTAGSVEFFDALSSRSQKRINCIWPLQPACFLEH